MPRYRKDREAAVDTLTRDLEGVDGLVVAGYVGVRTPELNELRGRLRPVKARCRVVKNRLAKLALKNRGIDPGFSNFFEGQSALILQQGETVAGLKVLVDFEKDHANLKIRAGFIDGRIFQSAELKMLASLPPRPVLLAQLLGRWQGPMTSLAGVLSAGVRNLAVALDQLAKKKSKTEAA